MWPPQKRVPAIIAKARRKGQVEIFTRSGDRVIAVIGGSENEEAVPYEPTLKKLLSPRRTLRAQRKSGWEVQSRSIRTTSLISDHPMTAIPRSTDSLITRSCLLLAPPSSRPLPQSPPSRRAGWCGRVRRSASRFRQTTPVLPASTHLPDRMPAPAADWSQIALLSEKHSLPLQRAQFGFPSLPPGPFSAPMERQSPVQRYAATVVMPHGQSCASVPGGSERPWTSARQSAVPRWESPGPRPIPSISPAPIPCGQI